ncbi:MAG: class I SAM-dependent RNA methyltransferase, partial [Spirochaetales bacterium]|nr:class I SAM-dependent RNA methyltransferase [Candidatus Physcosoma equi]
TYLVAGALPGESVEVKVLSERRGTVEAVVSSVLEPSPLRKDPVCPYYGICGGCDFQIVSPSDSASLKEEIVKDDFLRIGGMKELPSFDPPVYGEFEGYRSRARVHVNLKTKEQGFLASSSNRLVTVDHCPALDGKLDALLGEKGGDLFRRARSLMFENRVNRDTGFVEVPLFSGDKAVSDSQKSVQITVGDTLYNVSASVFFQSNPRLLPELFRFVKENVVGDNIMDLYSGVGTFSALFTGSGKTLYAVEREKLCLELSRKNAPDAISFTDDVAKWAKNSGRKADTVIVDPPRVGLEKSVIEMIQNWNPERIIYVSCNPVTAARDLSLFSCYRIEKARVFDFYPGSSHIETGLVLSRR